MAARVDLHGVRVATAGSYDGPGRLDVRRSTAEGLARAFIPAGPTLSHMISTLRRADVLAQREGEGSGAEQMERRAREVFDDAYLAEMRISAGFDPSKKAWEAMSRVERAAIDGAKRNGALPFPEAWAALHSFAADVEIDGEPHTQIVVVCGCGRLICHRRLLAGIFVRLGAYDAGELGERGGQPALFAPRPPPPAY
jgi:hypothetical protein